MGIDDRVFADEASARLQGDLRQQVAAALLDRADLITADAVAIFPHSGLESLDADYCGRLGNLLTLLLTFAVRDAIVGSRSRLRLKKASCVLGTAVNCWDSSGRKLSSELVDHKPSSTTTASAGTVLPINDIR